MKLYNREKGRPKVMMEVHNVYAGYWGKPVLHDINLSFHEGINIVLGPNGAGKTTLFRVCSGVLKPYKGEVLVDGRDVYRDAEARKLIGYLPHRDGLIEGLTVKENLLFYAKIYGINNIDERIEELNKIVNIENLFNTRVAELSHGQRRRVALLRTLLHNPKVLLLDEPSEGLDPLTAKNLREFIKDLSHKGNFTVVYSTHNLYEALELAERIVVIKNGGVVLQGTLDELKRFLGKIKVGLRVRGDPRPILNSMGYNVVQDGKMWVTEVNSEDEIGRIVDELTKNKITVLEIKEIGNPLEEILERMEGD